MREFMAENLKKTIDLLQKNDFVKRKDLCNQLDVSLATVQNYINFLRQKGYIIKSKKGKEGGIFLENKKYL